MKMTEPHTERRIPWVALALSFLSMGVGHVYCGRIAKGLVLYLAWFMVPVLCVLAAVLPVSSVTLLACVLLPTICIVVVYFYAALDAYGSAKQSDPCYRLHEYNRAGIYVLMVLVQLCCPLALMAGTRAFVLEAFIIPTRSMSPNILQGDRILVNKLAARQRFPQRGDVVVFKNPGSGPGSAFIMRVVALAGDTVVVEGEHVEINGKSLQRDRIPSEALYEVQRQPGSEVHYEFNAGRRYRVGYGDSDSQLSTRGHFECTVPDRSVFVLGDNRDRSRDSRHFGSIHVGDIIGYVQYIYFPAANWSRFGAYRD